ncbi:LacI family DNA-binding transcriptional regulator [Streptomyces sp. 3MP-14]|uniref:LacI family DNA-binding transcriptional regulator n=1 Tax=Streptomyces mimosae TaxID=2586635 RepID=A0A5N6AGI6_9ACTN|nr:MULTISPECIES: LacI family DNA-binding transcriptional regulator [Streptomyces]KAB8167771.1 LacI family DNA-binding transcriptional regulator [Streptomyces mimosae]KAB8177581.1 LacI family DNA-binding transcriptional regulator [Streptomyces sp. 3MP-14]
MKRPTMQDIAHRAGVTKAAVSFALNGRPGVSETTRGRILAIAEELGWQPSSAARALSDGRAGAFGMVIDRPAHTLGLEPFFMQLISGIQAELATDTTPLLLTMAEDQAAEIALYRSWWARRAVDGVFLVDLQVADARVPVLEQLGMPTVVIGAPVGTGRLPAVWSDDAAAVTTAVIHLADLGHRRLARVSGPNRLRHTSVRTAAFERVTAELGLGGRTLEADYSGEGGAAATRELLDRERPPTAIIYDNDVMALSGVAAAQNLGLRVPTDLSVVAWDDSALCELVNPPLTALRRDIGGYGARAARRLRAAAGGERPGDLQDTAPSLTLRGSTAPPPPES